MFGISIEKPYVQQYPIDSAQPTFTKEIDASTLWKKIVHNAWKSAEPGVLFWDTIIRESVPDCYADLGYRTVSTNPCGEIPLCPYDSCRLLAINLYSYVVNPFKPDAYFDFDLFQKHVALAQRLYATDMPGILTEIGFLSNSEEYAYMNSAKGQAQIARALCDAVKDYVAFVRGALLVDDDAIYEQADADVAEPASAAASDKADKGSVKTGKAEQEKTFYAVQLIASAKRVPPKDRQFKSYRGKVTEFVTGGRFRYKYCVGRFDTRKQAEAKLAEVRREFRDAFVVSCRGDRIVQ
jgi:hypothetical protein